MRRLNIISAWIERRRLRREALQKGVSRRTLEGMSLNIDDRKYLKQEQESTQLYLAEILIEHSAKMERFMVEIQGNLSMIRDEQLKISKRLDSHEIRILQLENCMGLNKAG
jgi:hypothetical protein